MSLGTALAFAYRLFAACAAVGVGAGLVLFAVGSRGIAADVAGLAAAAGVGVGLLDFWVIVALSVVRDLRARRRVKERRAAAALAASGPAPRPCYNDPGPRAAA